MQLRWCSMCYGLFVFIATSTLAEPLGPGNFTSLGVLDPGDNTSIQINTSRLSMTIGVTSFFSGVESNGIAVFTFDRIHIPPNVVVTAGGSRPLALLSRGEATVAGRVSLDAQAGPGGWRGGAAGQKGGGPGGGRAGFDRPILKHVGGFGGETPAPIDQGLLAGNGGGGGITDFPRSHGFNPPLPFGPGGAGGRGGGAIEIGAIGTLSLAGSVDARGAAGSSVRFVWAGGGGGGSGGHVFLHASDVVIDQGALIDTTGGEGGDGGSSSGGSGWGGL